MDFENRNLVIVTGAGKGLGFVISKMLVESNYAVVGIGRHLTEEFKSLSSDQSHFIEFDLLHIDKIQGLVNVSIFNTVQSLTFNPFKKGDIQI